MKTKYKYYSLRFPNIIASLCFEIQHKFNATYIDLPFLLPMESELCEYRGADIITYENRKYYIANEKMDVCFKTKSHFQERCFGVINVTKSLPKYVFWTTFYDESLENLMAEFKGSSSIRVYADPARSSITLRCDDNV